MTILRLGQRLGKHARKWLSMAFCLATFVAGHASMNTPDVPDESLTALKVFADAPLEALDMIRPSARLDMIDYYVQADSLLAVANALGGESRFEQVAPDYLKVAVTPVSSLEIKVLPMGKKSVVMALYTTGAPDAARDTDVMFFDSDMQRLDTRKILKAPVLTDFFTLKGSGIGEDDLREKVGFVAVEFSTGPGSEPLKATLTSLRVVSQDDADLLTPLLTPTLSSPWKGKYDFK